MIFQSLISAQIKLAPFLSAFTIIRSNAQVRLPPKTVIMSFDDGPNPAHSTTERLLYMLKKYTVKAHFSLIGKNIELYPEITRSIALEGHSIANHGYGHLFPLNTTKTMMEQDIKLWEETIHYVLGNGCIDSRFYRPPYGIYGFSMSKIIREHGFKLLPVSFYTMDAEYGPSRINTIVKRTIEGVTYMKGGIIVLHDGKDIHGDLLYSNDPDSKHNRSWIPEAAEIIINNFKNKGYQFALLDDFL